MSKPSKVLRVGTLNVDQMHEDSTLLLHLLKEKNLDIIGLQEIPKNKLPPLAAALGDYDWCESHSVAILSRYKLEPITAKKSSSSEGGHVRHTTARVTIPGEDGGLQVTCVHLDRKKESTRLSEVRQLMSLYGPQNIMLWLGDFDALTRSDYSDEEWNAITEQRRLNSWEEPVDDLMSFLTGEPQPDQTGEESNGGLGFSDAWKAASDQAGPVATSRFTTRVDYVFASPAMMNAWEVQSCEHVDAAPLASDHNLVVATFVKRDQ